MYLYIDLQIWYSMMTYNVCSFVYTDMDTQGAAAGAFEMLEQWTVLLKYIS